MRDPRSGRSRRTNNEPTRRIVLRGATVGALFLAALYLSTTLFNGVPMRDYGKVYLSAKQLGNIATHDPVRIAGVRVGQVVGSDLGDDGRARVELQLEPGVSIPVDSEIRIRANGLLGARYIELRPGHSSRDYGHGATVRLRDDALTYGVPETLDTFDARTRGRLRDALGGLGQALLGRGEQLNDTVRDVAREVPDALRFLHTMLEDPAANRALIPAIESGMSALDANREAIGELLDPAADAVAPLADERRAVQAALEAAPPSLRAASSGLGRSRQLLAAVRSLANEARATLAFAPGGLRATTALLEEARSPVRRTKGLLEGAHAAVPDVLRLTDALHPVLKPLRGGLDAALPTVAALGRYGCDIQNFATTWRSMTGYGGPGEGPAGPAMAFRLQLTPPAPGEALGVPDRQSHKDPYSPPCRYRPSVYPNVVSSSGSAR